MGDIDWVYRGDWGARSAKGGYGAMPLHPRGVKIHYTGGRENPGMINDHRLCVSRVKSIQNGHMDGNGWIDVGYSYLVCAHGKVFVGRGWGNLPAANGAGLNSGHYAILGMVGNAGLTAPTDEMLAAIRDVIEYLRGRGVGTEIKGHRNGFATDCPGTALYSWVLRGAPRPRITAPPVTKPEPTLPAPTKPPVEDEDMGDYTALGLSPAQSTDATRVIPPGVWFDVPFDTEWSDPTKSHTDAGVNPSFLNGPARYSLDLEIVVKGLLGPETVATRLVEVKAGTSPAEILEETQGRVAAFSPNTSGESVVSHSGIGAVQEGRKLRAQICHTGTSGPVTLHRAWVRMLTQEA